MEPSFDPQHRFGQDSVSDAQHRFDGARMAAKLRSLLRILTRQSATLVPFDAVRDRLGDTPLIKRGVQIIPLEAIVGSVERDHDFTREFLPLYNDLRARWERIDEATMRLENVPPIDVYQLGQIYFVRDGNHRVSVARFNGATSIEANITEIPLQVALTPDMDVNQLILAVERSEEKIDRLHARAVAIDALIDSGALLETPTEDALERELNALGSAEAVEAELADLKRQLEAEHQG